MRSFPVIIHFDILKDFIFSFLPRFKPVAINFLNFQRVDETLGNRVVPTIAFTAHARGNPVFFKQRLVITAGVLTAPVRVMDQPGHRIPSANGLIERVLRQIYCH